MNPQDPSTSRERSDNPERSRSAGLLLHPTSLPGRFGIGDLGPDAVAVLDWMREAGLSVWQVLPLGPTGMEHSPYSSFSAYAGNPLLISPERLLEDGLVDESALRAGETSPASRIDFAAVERFKETLMRSAFARFRAGASSTLGSEHAAFASADRRSTWLDDWTLYAAIKRQERGRSWLDWPQPLRDRQPKALAAARKELSDEIAFSMFEQFLFFRQWGQLRAAARERSISILGDVPIYVALDSADVWSRRELFDLHRDGRPRAVAGVPPDYFSADGQLWGNPIYRWKEMARDGYSWWLDRIAADLERADRLRLDHFRGFVAYWRVRAGARTARNGRWVAGPGEALFKAARKRFGGLPFVAEDLGDVDEAVHALRRKLALPGMRVLQFGFAEKDSLHAPHRHEPLSVAYTGTHDNDTAKGWIAKAGDEEKARALACLGGTVETISESIVRAAFVSPAALAIFPLQELLGLGSEARMNLPSTQGGNWSWRARHSDVPADLKQRIRGLAEASARI